MDSMEVNKAMAAVLIAGIAFFVTGTLGDKLVQARRPHAPAIKIEVAAAPAAATAAVVLAPLAPLLASADLAAGEAAARRQCASCHTFNQGGKNGVGPNLYDSLGAARATGRDGFAYSPALKSKAGNWGYEDMNLWLHRPNAYAPGTRMAFAGIPSDKQRADVIAYLRSLSTSPLPLP